MAKSKKKGRKWGRTALAYEQIDEILRDFEGRTGIGKVKTPTMKDLAAKYGVSAPTLKRWIKEKGYIHDGTGRYPKAMKARAKELYERGWDTIEIANLLEVKPAYVMEWTGQPGRLMRGPLPEGARLRPALGGPGYLEKPREAPIEGERHVRGKWWREHHKREVFRLLHSGLLDSVAKIYWATGASRVRQRQIWREYAGPTQPFPFPKKRRVSRAELRIGQAESIADAAVEAANVDRMAFAESVQSQIDALLEEAQALPSGSEQRGALEDAAGALSDVLFDLGLAAPEPEDRPPELAPEWERSATARGWDPEDWRVRFGSRPFRRLKAAEKKRALAGPPSPITPVAPESIPERWEDLELRRLQSEADFLAEEERLRRLESILKQDAREGFPAVIGDVEYVTAPQPTITMADVKRGLDDLEELKQLQLPFPKSRKKRSKKPKKNPRAKKKSKRGSTNAKKRATKKSSTKKAPKKASKRTSAKRKTKRQRPKRT
jgi:hypothetical protein